MPEDQRIEEVAQPGQGLVLVGGLAWELLDKAAGGPRRNLAEFHALGLAPGQKLADGPSIRPPGGEICAEKNSSAVKQAARPARTSRAGKAVWRSVSVGDVGVFGKRS